MTAPRDPEPDPAQSAMDPGHFIKVAIFLVIPVYIGIAILIDWLGNEVEPDANRHFMGFAVCSTIGLGCAVFSFYIRRYLENRQTQDPSAPSSKPLIIALALSEVPALLGLVYFFFFREWSGNILLLTASFLAFIFHGKRKGQDLEEEQGDSFS